MSPRRCCKCLERGHLAAACTAVVTVTGCYLRDGTGTPKSPASSRVDGRATNHMLRAPGCAGLAPTTTTSRVDRGGRARGGGGRGGRGSGSGSQ
jgi:hypothetical protein